MKVIRESAKGAPEVIRPSDNLELDLGLDSMQRIELLVAVEKELGGDVEESAMAEIYTVRQLVDAIRESAAAGKTRTSSSQQPAGWKSVLQEDPTDPEVLALARSEPAGGTLSCSLWLPTPSHFCLRPLSVESERAGKASSAKGHTSFLPIIKVFSTRW